MHEYLKSPLSQPQLRSRKEKKRPGTDSTKKD